MFVTKWVKEANIQQIKVKMQQETSNRVILYQKKILQECVIIGDDGVKFLCGIYVHYNTLRVVIEVGRYSKDFFLKGAYLKRCHKTIKGFSYDPLGSSTSTTLLKDIPYFGQHFGPHVEE